AWHRGDRRETRRGHACHCTARHAEPFASDALDYRLLGRSKPPQSGHRLAIVKGGLRQSLDRWFRAPLCGGDGIVFAFPARRLAQDRYWRDRRRGDREYLCDATELND